MKKMMFQIVWLTGLLMPGYTTAISGCSGVTRQNKATYVKNVYKGSDGGYLAVYSRLAVYVRKSPKYLERKGGGIKLVGFIRWKGKYFGKKFIPFGYKYKDNITQDPILKATAMAMFPWASDPWVGGDTGSLKTCVEGF